VETVFNAANNPQLANQLVQEALATPVEPTSQAEVSELKPAPLPPDTTVKLTAGLFDLTGDIAMEAEIRELTGVDEEAVARITDMGKSLLAILQRGVVSIGGTKATQEMLDDLLVGDRELLLLAIRRATFGETIELEGPCPDCSVQQSFMVDLGEVEIKRLENPEDRVFTVEGKAGTFTVTLPSGHIQKKLVSSSDKTGPEMDTMVLKECVTSINDLPVLDIKQIRNLSVQDRRSLISEISKRSPGPQLSEIKKTCTACGSEVPLPLTVADVFRL